jgi:AcrR family transcriptional regulator
MDHADGKAPEDQRDGLLECALRVIATRGYDSVRLRDVAVEAGVTTGMIQYYFDSREELLTAAMEKLGLLQIETWDKLQRVDGNPLHRLHAFIEHPAGGTSQAPWQSAAWLEFCAAAARNDRLRDVLKSVYRRWRELIVETIELGVQQNVFAPSLPVDILAETLILLLDGSDIGVGSRAGNLSAGEIETLTLSVMDQLVGLASR